MLIRTVLANGSEAANTFSIISLSAQIERIIGYDGT